VKKVIFSKRYKNLIDVGNGEAKDNICGEIAFVVKKEIASVLRNFAEPAIIKPYRYDNYQIQTDALHLAIDKLNEIMGFPVVQLRRNIFDGWDNQDVISNIFTPWLFDLIEIQYVELSNDEKKEFQVAINTVFQNNDIPWILSDGLMVKIDSQQFELDLRAKALAVLHELKDSNPKFQSAYNELMKACEFFEKGNHLEAISNAGKSYESVLKVICGMQKGNADKLTKEYSDKKRGSLPATMNYDGFREKVMMALPFIRNNSSSDHGAGETPIIVTRSFARLAINLSAAMNTYLIEEYIATMNTFEAIGTTDGKSDEHHIR
jgi:hypothetical protein